MTLNDIIRQSNKTFIGRIAYDDAHEITKYHFKGYDVTATSKHSNKEYYYLTTPIGEKYMIFPGVVARELFCSISPDDEEMEDYEIDFLPSISYKRFGKKDFDSYYQKIYYVDIENAIARLKEILPQKTS